MPAVTATAARDGSMKKVVGVSRLATSTRAGTSRERMTRVMTTPMKRSNPVQVPPVITWMKVSRYRLLLAKAAIRTRGGMTPMAKLQRSSRLVNGGSVEGRERRLDGSEGSVAGPGCTGSPDRTRPQTRWSRTAGRPYRGPGCPKTLSILLKYSSGRPDDRCGWDNPFLRLSVPLAGADLPARPVNRAADSAHDPKQASRQTVARLRIA